MNFRRLSILLAGLALALPLILLTGGTGLYLKALTRGLFSVGESDRNLGVRNRLQERLREEGREVLFRELIEKDPATAARLHPNDTQRLLRALEIYQTTGSPWSEHLLHQGEAAISFPRLRQIGLSCERQVLYRRIEERSEQMLAQGLLTEVAKLREMKTDDNILIMDVNMDAGHGGQHHAQRRRAAEGQQDAQNRVDRIGKRMPVRLCVTRADDESA